MGSKIKNKSNSINKAWGGRFSRSPHKLLEEINSSIEFDQRLYLEDIRASKVHAAMLGKQKIVSSGDVKKIIEGLDLILLEMGSGKFIFRRDLEDIHMNIEFRLRELIGDIAGHLHTARSRNDQVAVDFKMWVRNSIDVIDQLIKSFQSTLINNAEKHAESIMPGFTHMQIAQPVTLGHHLLAYVEMLGRDRERLRDCRKRLNESPLGVAALGGTSFPIDRDYTSTHLDFDRPSTNSIDTVSDRDFALEYLSAISILSIHLSRFAEEYVLWCTSQFGYVKVGDGFSTGSSIMPQKRNPDAAELVRAKTGRIIGALSNLLVVMKGLPMSYGKDMQEDKEPVFQVHDTITLLLETLNGMLIETAFDKERMASDAKKGFSTATDLADWLTKNIGVPFRESHHITGQIVKLAEKNKTELAALSLAQLKSIDSRIDKTVYDVLDVNKAVKSRTSFGGTAPENVMDSISAARKRFLD